MVKTRQPRLNKLAVYTLHRIGLKRAWLEHLVTANLKLLAKPVLVSTYRLHTGVSKVRHELIDDLMANNVSPRAVKRRARRRLLVAKHADQEYTTEALGELTFSTIRELMVVWGVDHRARKAPAISSIISVATN